jgi:hypothetical protein
MGAAPCTCGMQVLQSVYRRPGHPCSHLPFCVVVTAPYTCDIQEHPEDQRARLEAFLGEKGISYSYSQTSKFANFINKSLL